MDYQDKDVVFAQITNCLVEQYGYNIVRFSEHKYDIWLTNKDNKEYPILRLNSLSASSIIFEKDYLDKAKNFLEVFMGKYEKVWIINTNEDSVEFEDDGFEQLIVSADKKHTKLSKAFPELDTAIRKVEDNEKEIKRLNDNLLRVQESKQRQQQRKANKMPKFTAGIAIICVLCFIASMLVVNAVGDESAGLIISGAYYKLFVANFYEYWRFFTSGFLHLSLFHLMVNMMALYSLGNLIEKMYTKRQYILILFVAILLGNAFAFLLDGNILAVGLSGGLYGLMAACIVYTVENQTIKIPMIRSAIVRTVMINVIISFMPGISLTAHLGGFIGGGFIALIVIKSKRWASFKPHLVASFVLMLGVLGYFTYMEQKQSVQPLFPGTDNQVVKGYRKLGFKEHARKIEKELIKIHSDYTFAK